MFEFARASSLEASQRGRTSQAGVLAIPKKKALDLSMSFLNVMERVVKSFS